MTLEQELLTYQPANEQEARDLPKMLAFLREGKTPFDRANETAHFTASAWVIGRAGTPRYPACSLVRPGSRPC